ncbi:MAG: hypothetical protein ABI352_03035 [Candidatus Dormibacter sp.]
MRTRRLPAALMLGATAASVLFVWAGSTSAAAAWAQGGSLPGLGSGRIWSLAASPATAGFVAAGTDSGVYVTTDSGATWSLTSLKGVRVWAVGFDARNAKRLFAGTDGAGAELSSDGGASWTKVSAGLPDLAVRSFAFGLDGIAAGTNKGVALSPDGTTWHDGGLEQYSISSVAVAANSPSLILVAATDRGDLSNGYLFRYSGTGTAWQPLVSGLPAAALATSVAAGPLSTSVTKRPLMVTTSKGFFRSGDSGSTWTAATGIAENLTVTSATFSPLDPSLVYAGADAGSSTGGDLLRSTDGGMSFSASDQGLPAKTRQVESIAVAPTKPPTVFAALDPAGGGQVYGESDTTAPAPPTLVPEAPGVAVPATLSTPAATASPTARAAITPAATTTAFGRFVGNVFHWPVPLVFEVLLVLAIAYVFVRWRQRYYVEGPP